MLRLPPLKMEGEAGSQGLQPASRTGKGRGHILLWGLQKKHNPVNNLMLAQGNLYGLISEL